MHEFMEFYRMDYTSNIFVNESNYQGQTDRHELGGSFEIGCAPLF